MSSMRTVGQVKAFPGRSIKYVVQVNVAPNRDGVALKAVRRIWEKDGAENRSICMLEEMDDIFLVGAGETPPLKALHEIRRVEGVSSTELIVLDEVFSESGEAKGEPALIFFDTAAGREHDVLKAVRKILVAEKGTTVLSLGYIYQMSRDVFSMVVTPSAKHLVGRLRAEVEGLLDTEWYHLKRVVKS